MTRNRRRFPDSRSGRVRTRDRPAALAVVAAATVVAVVVTVLAVPAPVGVSGVAVARRAAASGLPTRMLAALLVLLGGGAVLVALFDDPLFGLLGGSAGGAAATALLYRREGREVDGDAAFGAVLVHRGLEGGLLAAAAATDVVVGVAGALVLALHAAGETAAVGALYGARSRRRAVAAVLAVQAVFVLGAVGGGAAVAVLPPAVRVVALSLSGGVLATVGVHTARHSHGADSHGVGPHGTDPHGVGRQRETHVATDDAGSGVVVSSGQIPGDESHDVAK
ncbi:hypothetical protein [Haloprofundus halophilus]|uniref:hypothetical protein n=1 Tax=Haloprofundus halophilus TaxID=2283527 RepID=UPI00130064A5|nr:hypothetical protein [Haloprofundus halophilus]